MKSTMRTEMDQQPSVIRALIGKSESDASRIRSTVPSPPVGVVVIARGSSLNAGTYLAYAIEVIAGIPVSLARPSVFTRYGAKPNFTGWVAIALSQSGNTPEIASAAQAVVDCGATLITVTNDSTSRLALLGSLHLDLGAGEERAVPATKTVSAQMVCALIVAASLGELNLPLIRALDQLPAAVESMLEDRRGIESLAVWAYFPGLTVLGRGFGFAAAHEIALKVREVAGILGEAWSVTAFKHGPIAGVGANVPLLICSMTSALDEDTADVIAQLTARGNPIARCMPDTSVELPLPLLSGEFAELMTPILAVIRGQQLSEAMALEIDHDPDHPIGLRKVTLTK
jgi:glutamine---fructose-6-phosphate transaminase (isomerizing)